MLFRSEYPLPGLLILDLKMPRMTGFDVLAWLAKHPRLNVLPTVVLSSSSHHADIAKAREMGAKEFYVKPHALKEMTNLLQQLAAQWLGESRFNSK